MLTVSSCNHCTAYAASIVCGPTLHWNLPMNISKYTSVIALMLVGTMTLAADDAAMDKPTFYASQTETVTATVEAIDHETRAVTLLRADGEVINFVAGEEARNLDQVSIGDIVVAQYVSSISVKVVAGDDIEPGQLGLAAMERSEKGEMPGVMAVDTEVIVATVVDINIEANTFQLKGVDGSVEEYVAMNPENLKRAEVGDAVIITVSSAIAISVEPGSAE